MTDVATPRLNAEQGEYFRIRPTGRSEAITIAFADGNVPAGSYPAALVQGCPGSNVQLNSPPGQAYQLGVPGHRESFDDLVNWVRDLADERGRGAVTLVGQGVGGRAALLIGGLVNSVNVLAISPELTLGLHGGHSNKVTLHPWWGSLQDVARVGRGRRRCISLYSPWNPLDAHFLSLPVAHEPSLGVALEMKGAGDPVARLKDIGCYADLLAQDADLHTVLRDSTIALSPFSIGARAQYEHFHNTFEAYSGRAKSLPQALELAADHSQWANPGWQNLRSNIYRLAEMPEQALAASDMALAIDDSSQEYCVGHARNIVQFSIAKRVPDAVEKLKPFLSKKGVPDLQKALLSI